MTKTKVCTKCGKRKPWALFGARAAMADGLRSQCRACDAEDRIRWGANGKSARYQKQRREANPERSRARARAWYAANRDKCVARQLAYQARNPEKVRERARRWRLANGELVRARRRAYVAANPRYREYEAAYKALYRFTNPRYS
jgi:valyl-tRNA synthetase